MTAVQAYEGNSTYPYGAKWCGMHGSYYGDRCPYCPYVQPTVTVSPVSTEDALAALVRLHETIINDLREQVADRDRQIAELKAERE